MSTFTATAGMMPEARPDPMKHVKYNVGMVLGVDDFNQEFAYLLGRDQWMARDLIGYGTVSGLQVSVEADAGRPRVRVEEGVALSPKGQLVRVPTAQCAYLNDWLKLDATKKKLLQHLGSPIAPLKLYVVLCYRDCPVDKVPIPGEPCRSEDNIMLPSRLIDDFRLELMFDPPGQREEDAIRDFVSWLRQIEISDTAASTDPKKFLDAIRAGSHLFTSPPTSGSGPLPDYMFDSPPTLLVINSADLCEYLDAAFRLWVTELRPKWRPDFFSAACGCGEKKNGSTAVEECLLLAELDTPIVRSGPDWQVESPTAISIDEKRRPVVIHLRMLQEMLLCGRQPPVLTSPLAGGAGIANLAGDAAGPVSATRVERIRGVPVDATPPTSDQVLRFAGGQWRPSTLPPSAAAISPSTAVSGEQSFDLPSNPGLSNDYSRGDHTHGTPPDPIPLHRTDTASHATHIIRGDVTGTLAATTVNSIRNSAVVGTPSDGQVLTFRSNQWQGESLPVAPTNVVEHPVNLPKYFIVAAGRVRCDGTSIGPVYNKLTALADANNEILVHFDRYKEPDNTFQYIMKVLPVFNEAFRIPVITFSRFQAAPAPDGIVLRVTNGGNPVSQENLRRLELMIEVSQYFDRI